MSAAEGIQIPLSLETKGLNQSLGSMEAVLAVLKSIESNVGNISGKMDAFGNSLKDNFEKGKKGAAGLIDGLGRIGLAIQGAKGVLDSMSSLTQAYDAQSEAETKLAQVMRNTMGATDEDIQSIKDLASAQQQLGVVGDEVQLAGAQELATYLEKKEALQELLPVLNDMVAQQYGLNATQESSVTIATMLGKVMEGQTSALSRYGYSFDEAQEKILKTGTEMERVATLAEVVSNSVGGVNESLAQTDSGRVKQMANSWGDVQEEIGRIIRDVQAMLLPLANEILPVLSDSIKLITETLKGQHPVLAAIAAVVGSVCVGFAAYNAYTKAAAMWTTIMTAKQWLLNIAMDANPIGLVVAAIAAMIALVTVCIHKYDEWGAAIMLVAGPIGWIVNMVQSFRRNWDDLVNTFKTEGIIAGFKKIGKVLLDSVLYPLQQMLELLGGLGIPGLSKLASKGSASIQGLRASLGVNMGGIVPGTEGDGTMGGGGNASPSKPSAMAAGTSAVATGGTRNTSITISMGSLVHQISYNGGIKENTRETTQDLQEALLRVLNAAANTAS